MDGMMMMSGRRERKEGKEAGVCSREQRSVAAGERESAAKERRGETIGAKERRRLLLLLPLPPSSLKGSSAASLPQSLSERMECNGMQQRAASERGMHSPTRVSLSPSFVLARQKRNNNNS